jgi:hypothetical protein
VKALSLVSRCLDLARDTAAGYGGRLVKTIGDAVMVVFPTADQAGAAAAEIQNKTSKLAQSENIRLAFRIGFHAGVAIEQDGDVYGDCVNIAARMVALAKGGQIIVSASTAQVLSPYLRQQLRDMDDVTVKGKVRDMGIAELVWQDPADLTTLATRPSFHGAEIELQLGERTIRLNAETAALTIGRDAGNDVVIASKRASRHHARIERRRDRFVLVDQSSNGTYVTFEGETEIMLHHEELRLRGRGQISLGLSSELDPGEVLRFNCVEHEA